VVFDLNKLAISRRLSEPQHGPVVNPGMPCTMRSASPGFSKTVAKDCIVCRQLSPAHPARRNIERRRVCGKLQMLYYGNKDYGHPIIQRDRAGRLARIGQSMTLTGVQ